MPIQGPIDRLTHDTLRTAVLLLRESERRRRFAPTLHVGCTTGTVVHLTPDEDRLDTGARTDLVLAMLQRAMTSTPRTFIWLARPGALSPHDVDVPWASAVRWAAATASAETCFVVVTHQGWFDPETGVSRQWRRLRRHSGRRPIAQGPQSHV